MKESGYLMALKTLFFIRNRHEDYPRNILIPPFRGFVQKYPDTAAQSISIYGKISAITFILLEKPDVLFDKH